MSSGTTAVFKIIPTTQKYDWGKIGLTSKVAQFACQSQIPGFKIDERSPYAEVVFYFCIRPSSERRDDNILTSYGWALIRRRPHLY